MRHGHSRVFSGGHSPRTALLTRAAGDVRLRLCVGCRRRSDPSQLIRVSLQWHADPSLAGESSAPAGWAVTWPPVVITPVIEGRDSKRSPSSAPGTPATRSALGRSAYVHPSLDCVLRASRPGVLEHAFRLPKRSLGQDSTPQVSLPGGQSRKNLSGALPLGARKTKNSRPQEAVGPLASLINFLIQTPQDLRETNSYE